jgi:hypothetical protein
MKVQPKPIGNSSPIIRKKIFYSLRNRSLSAGVWISWHITPCYIVMATRMIRTLHLRRIAGVMLTVYSALLVLNAVHVHHSCLVPAMEELRGTVEDHPHAHVHGAAECPLRLFFSNPVLTDTEHSPLDGGSFCDGVLPVADDAVLPQLRYLHPALRAPPSV